MPVGPEGSGKGTERVLEVDGLSVGPGDVRLEVGRGGEMLGGGVAAVLGHRVVRVTWSGAGA